MRPFRILSAILAASILSACSGDDLTTPKGPVFAFNPGDWQPTSADMAVPTRAKP